MKDKYIVYLYRTSNKLYESDSLEDAARFVENLESEKKQRGDNEYEKYEIIRAAV